MEGAAPAQSVFFKPQEVVVTDTWPPPSIPMVATPTRPQQQQPSQPPPQQPTRPAADSWHTLQGVSSSWARSQGQQPAGMQYRSGGGGMGMRDPRTVQPPPPPAEIASSWGEAAELEALYHTKVAETLHHVEVAKRLRGRLVASRDALAVRRQCVIDNRAAAIASLQRQFTELQNQLLCELRRAVGAVETAEHAAVRPLEAEMDGMVQRVQDIDRLAELTALKIRCEPKHKFVEYARLLQQDLAAATAVPVPDASFHPNDAEIRMPAPPVVSVVLGEAFQPPPRPDTRNAKVQTDTDGPVVVEELKKLASWLADHQENNLGPGSGYTASVFDELEESNRDLTVPVDAHTTPATEAASSPPTVDRRQQSATGTGTGSGTGIAAASESKGAADLARLEQTMAMVTNMYSETSPRDGRDRGGREEQ